MQLGVTHCASTVGDSEVIEAVGDVALGRATTGAAPGRLLPCLGSAAVGRDDRNRRAPDPLDIGKGRDCAAEAVGRSGTLDVVGKSDGDSRRGRNSGTG